jgi:hypothetical protein
MARGKRNDRAVARGKRKSPSIVPTRAAVDPDKVCPAVEVWLTVKDYDRLDAVARESDLVGAGQLVDRAQPRPARLSSHSGECRPARDLVDSSDGCRICDR